MLSNKDITIIEELIDKKLEKFEIKLENKLDQKLNIIRDEIFYRIDTFLGLYQKTDQEQILLTGRVSEHSDQLEDHENRIVHLEESKKSSPH